MNKIHIMAVLSIFLIITSTYSSLAASFYYDDVEDEENLGEIILVNVDRYEPTTVSSDYLRNRNFPVHVYLTGTTLEGSLFGSQSPNELETAFGTLKIKNFRIIQQTSSKYISGVQPVPPQGGYLVTSDGKVDLGYLRLYLKKQPIEEKIPDVLDLNLTARVEFDVDSGYGIFGKQSLYFDSNTEGNKQSIWEGSAYLELISASIDKARFQMYDASGNRVGSPFDLTLNGNPRVESLRDSPSLF